MFILKKKKSTLNVCNIAESKELFTKFKFRILNKSNECIENIVHKLSCEQLLLYKYKAYISSFCNHKCIRHAFEWIVIPVEEDQLNKHLVYELSLKLKVFFLF